MDKIDVYQDIQPPATLGKGRLRYRTNNMGDNPMHDPTEKIIENATSLSMLNKTLNDCHIPDSHIVQGDFQVEMGTIVDFIKQFVPELSDEEAIVTFWNLVDVLGHRMMHGVDDELTEDVTTARFTYEADYMGNITIADGNTGMSVYLQGDDARKIEQELENASDEDKQEILSRYESVMESFEQRFDCSIDKIGNITVFDLREGLSVYVSGMEADTLKRKLSEAVDRSYMQSVLNTYAPSMSEEIDAATLVENAINFMQRL